MNHWPQLSIIAWLVVAMSSSAIAVARPSKSWIVLTQRHQRIAAAVFGTAALIEASLLTAGGFFQGMF